MTAPPAARAMQARFIKQTCAVRKDTERLMIGQSLSLIYAEGHTHAHTLCRL